MKKTLEILNAALRAVYDADSVDNGGGESTGTPRCGRRDVDVDAGLCGLIPSDVTWTQDRGRYMWDGVLVTLALHGVDTWKPVKPLEETVVRKAAKAAGYRGAGGGRNLAGLCSARGGG